MADFDTAQLRAASRSPAGGSNLLALALAAMAFAVCLALFAQMASASGSNLFHG